jgi:hypothetical protein
LALVCFEGGDANGRFQWAEKAAERDHAEGQRLSRKFPSKIARRFGCF